MVWNKTNNFGAGMLEKYILFSDIPVCNLYGQNGSRNFLSLYVFLYIVLNQNFKNFKVFRTDPAILFFPHS